MFTIRPYRWTLMAARTTAVETKNVPRRIVSTTPSQSAGCISTAGLRTFEPALFTRMSIRPKRSSTRSTIGAMVSTFAVSRVHGRTSTPSASSSR